MRHGVDLALQQGLVQRGVVHLHEGCPRERGDRADAHIGRKLLPRPWAHMTGEVEARVVAEPGGRGALAERARPAGR